MVDREKVIRGLKCIVWSDQQGTCNECKYFRPFTDHPDCGWCDNRIVLMDALELLREQEPVRFKVTQQRRSYPFWDAVCDGCGYKTCTIHTNWKYCPECGRRIKRDG